MEIKKTLNGKKLTVELSGRLDTNTSPELDKVLEASYKDIDELVLDLRVVFDDTVVNGHHVHIVADMGMGVVLGGFAVGCPSGVAYAHITVKGGTVTGLVL